jgi:hypothetical protein
MPEIGMHRESLACISSTPTAGLHIVSMVQVIYPYRNSPPFHKSIVGIRRNFSYCSQNAHFLKFGRRCMNLIL